MRILIAAALAACTRPTPDPGPGKFHFDVKSAGGSVPNAYELVAAREAPFRLEVTLHNGEEQWLYERLDYSKSHRISLLGLGADTTWTATASMTLEDGSIYDTKPLEFTTPSLPLDFPILQELTGSDAPLQNGYLLFDVKSVAKSVNYRVALDANLEVAWWQEDTNECTDIRMLPDGYVLGVCNLLATETNLLGETREKTAITDPNADEEDSALQMHHELFPLERGGFLTLHAEQVDVPQFPVSAEEPEELAPATIRADRVLLTDSDYQLIRSWSLADILPTQRIGYGSVSKGINDPVHDWSHANGVIQDPADNGIIVSIRHQDALVKLTNSGNLKWILANPSGWPEEWLPFLLSNPDNAPYPFHQHAPEIDEEGRLWIFDNGNNRSTPYDDAAPEEEYSRVVAYEIDEENMAFREVLAFDQSAEGRLFSAALGDADWLPHIGSVLSVWGRVPGETDWSKPLSSTTNTRARIMIHAPEFDEPAMDLEISGCRCDEETFRQEHRGWKVYRAEWLPRLYPLGTEPTRGPYTADSGIE